MGPLTEGGTVPTSGTVAADSAVSTAPLSLEARIATRSYPTFASDYCQRKCHVPNSFACVIEFKGSIG
ncbi:hypothetical protein Tco_0048951 [Tanacetum coccineum]